MTDFNELGLYILGLIIPTLYVLADYAVKTFHAWLTTKTRFAFLVPEKELSDALQGALDKGVSYAKRELQARDLTVDFDNELVGLAAQYVADSTPQALRRFGITDERLAKMVKARL